MIFSIQPRELSSNAGWKRSLCKITQRQLSKATAYFETEAEDSMTRFFADKVKWAIPGVTAELKLIRLLIQLIPRVRRNLASDRGRCS